MNQISDPKHAKDLCMSNLPLNWNETVYYHLRALYLYQNGNVIDAATEQCNCAQNFHRIFSDLDRWALPLHYIIHSDLYYLSALADKELAEKNEKATKLEDTARAINKAFTQCITDRRTPMTNSRKWGTYYIANLLFRTYFKLKSTNLCKNILRAIKVGDMPELENFPVAQQATFHYYCGLLNFLDEQYHEAGNHLLKAFRYIRGKSIKNELIILHLLIPIRLLSGVLPSKNLLNYHSSISETYSGMINAIHSGNVKEFEHCLRKQEKVLIRHNTYLTIEKCKLLCMRRLFKKVYIIEGMPTRMDVDSFRHALNFVAMNLDNDEVECLLAVMIEKGYIRGYISHEKRVVVLSASNAFPDITSISLA
jgi:tetratricopeptide (TPR) repeat protein